jgi:hypothetical protein
MTANNPDPPPEAQDLIEMEATTLLEVDQGQFDEAFEVLVRCRTRDLLRSHPDSPPDQIIAWVQEFIEALNCRVEQIRAAGGTHTGEHER